MSAVIAENKVTALEVLNFMCIPEARIEFDESGIINLCGYNDSGKSALIRALEVLLYDAYSTDQVNFIMDDCEFFGVGLEFSDGISINKYKYSNGKSVWEMLRGDDLLYTNRLSDGVASLGDIPDVISNYLGVVKDDITDEQLNVRRITDRLFLINTSGGDNYKIINSVLRCDILAESVKRMNEDRNKMQSDLIGLTNTRSTLRSELSSIDVVDEGYLNSIREISKNLEDNKVRCEYLTAIINQVEILDNLSVHEEVPLVDTARISALDAIFEARKNMDISIYDECSYLDISRLKELESIISLRGGIEVSIPPEVNLVSTERIKDIVDTAQKFNDLWNISNQLNQVIAEHDSVVAELSTLSSQYGFKICKTCGTVAG